MTTRPGRRTVAWCGLSIDGRTSGRRGPQHDTWLHQWAGTTHSEYYSEGVWRRATTVVMGRLNAEGFGAVWPALAVSPELGESSRAYGRFLVEVEKVGISRTLPPDGLDRFEWRNARVTDDLLGEIRSLRTQEGGDILIQNSASVIQQLLVADLLDDLRFVVLPVILGEGPRLLDDLGAMDESGWQLEESTTFSEGAVAVHYSRRRD